MASIETARTSSSDSTTVRSRTGWIAAGSLFGALAASSCCILPLVLFSLGISGAWISHFTALAPYNTAGHKF
jgi:mercuric ion transport protein